jgi:hypothetical protein
MIPHIPLSKLSLCERRSAAFLALILFCVQASSHPMAASLEKRASTKQNAAHANGAALPGDTSAWKTYRNEKWAFEVRYPETWRVNAGSGTGADIITIAKPFRTGEPNASLTLAVQKNQNPKKFSIEQWYSEQMKLMKVHPESSGNVAVGGQPAVFVENTNSFGKQRATFTLLNQTDVLSLSYKRQTELDATYSAIVASFRVLK